MRSRLVGVAAAVALIASSTLATTATAAPTLQTTAGVTAHEVSLPDRSLPDGVAAPDSTNRAAWGDWCEVMPWWPGC